MALSVVDDEVEVSEDRYCANLKCGKIMIRDGKGKRFCSAKCSRTWQKQIPIVGRNKLSTTTWT